ncbi:PEP-CTERM sorting domain-containing protein [Roseateles sp.]|uniref:PEP-CTERM sorting domain-containing protein n=1 Tax=Roseateles sp. TaxID=1971397 RepID=UPI0025F46C9E|nr:PEP-CTERM sorting domain-containing protein [Roseateles sp.]MBV8036691.1 PEP-CTERM sorting domain-containing protein [Roseateles sp.]
MTALTALIAGLAWSGAAQAYWGLDTTPTATVNDSAATAQNPYTVKMSGFYVSNTLNASNKLSGNWTAGTLTQYAGNGQGMSTGTDSGSPYHALDNNGNTEGVLLSFSASTVLTSIGLGYTATTGPAEYGCVSNGAVVGTVLGSAACSKGTKTSDVTVDVSVFRWTGTSAPTLAGTAAGTMGGWELVGNYGDFILDTTNPYNLVNSAGKTSSWWLITAYNSGFTQSAGTENRGTLTDGDDYFKLYAVAGNKCTGTVNANGVCGGTTTNVPEPATLALASVALIGVAGLRRRQPKANA